MKPVTKILISLILSSVAYGQAEPNERFLTAPEQYGIWRYHGWMSGNVTEEAITRDMERFKEEGGKGYQLFHSLGSWVPQDMVSKPAHYNTPEWDKMLLHLFREAEEKDMQIAVLSAPFWDIDGGPWVELEDAMKILVHTEQIVGGGRLNNIQLSQPLTRESYYRDVACLALPALSNDVSLAQGVEVFSSSKFYQDKPFEFNGQSLTVQAGDKAEGGDYIDFVLSQPTDISYMSLHQGSGVKFKVECTVQFFDQNNNSVGNEVSFGTNCKASRPFYASNLETVRASRVRLQFARSIPKDLSGFDLRGEAGIHNLHLKNGSGYPHGHGNGIAKKNQFEERGFVNESAGIALDEVIDLTDALDDQGRLNAELPQGDWRILRIGYTFNGKYTHGSKNEPYMTVDKLSPSGVAVNYSNLVGRIVKMARAEGIEHQPMAIYAESYESKTQNWTQRMSEEFQARRGYSLKPYLPVLCGGYVLGSFDASERFLRDFRRTIADLMAENYMGERTRLAHKDGLRSYGDNGGAQQFMYDAVNYQKQVDVPIGEFWVQSKREVEAEYPHYSIRQDIKNGSSAVHLYNEIKPEEQQIIGESFTSYAHNMLGPLRMKAIADAAFCRGLTTVSLHGTCLQPLDDSIKPGLTWGPYGPIDGMHTNTWWEHMDKLSAYFARCEALLRSGRFVGDFVYYVGDDIPNTLPFRDKLPGNVPAGYDFDGCDTGAITDLFEVDAAGNIVCPNGMSYRFLQLPNNQTMPLHVLQSIEKLVKSGATVVGPKPVRTPGLTGGMAESDEQLQALADKLWNDGQYGKGRVFEAANFAEIEQQLGLEPDFKVDFTRIQSPMWKAYNTANDPIEYIHRLDGETDIYFVNSHLLEPETIDCSFRVSGKTPQLWDPATGYIYSVPFEEANGRTLISIPFEKLGSQFVVFKPADSVEPAPLLTTDKTLLKEVTGPWELSFDPVWGGPEQASFDALDSWDQRPEEAIQYYSGKAIYRKTLDIEKPTDGRLLLELGDVKDVAKVILNGQEVGVAWLPPFAADITDHIIAGENMLEIEVINFWRNRMIGDQQHPMDFELTRGILSAVPDWLKNGTPRPEQNRYTFATCPIFEKDDQLGKAGLLGPVRLKVAN